MAKAPRNNIMPSSIQKGVFGLAVPFFWVLFCMKFSLNWHKNTSARGLGLGFWGWGGSGAHRQLFNFQHELE